MTLANIELAQFKGANFKNVVAREMYVVGTTLFEGIASIENRWVVVVVLDACVLRPSVSSFVVHQFLTADHHSCGHTHSSTPPTPTIPSPW